MAQGSGDIDRVEFFPRSVQEKCDMLESLTMFEPADGSLIRQDPVVAFAAEEVGDVLLWLSCDGCVCNFPNLGLWHRRSRGHVSRGSLAFTDTGLGKNMTDGMGNGFKAKHERLGDFLVRPATGNLSKDLFLEPFEIFRSRIVLSWHQSNRRPQSISEQRRPLDKRRHA